MKSVWKTKDAIVKWLTRIGIGEGDIDMKQKGVSPFVEWSDRNSYKAKRSSYDTVKRKYRLEFEHPVACVRYVYNGKEYELTCNLGEDYSENLNYIEILIHNRVLGIERGIENVETSFAGYAALPDFSNMTPRKTLGVGENATLEECRDKFKQLAKVYHPDVNGGNADQFLRLKSALELIEKEYQ